MFDSFSCNIQSDEFAWRYELEMADWLQEFEVTDEDLVRMEREYNGN